MSLHQTYQSICLQEPTCLFQVRTTHPFHLLYLLRTFLKDSGINNVSLKNSDSSIKLEIVLKTKERLTDVIKTFAVLKKLSNDIMADYDAEFDIWETKQGDPLLIVDYYSPEYGDDEDGAPF